MPLEPPGFRPQKDEAADAAREARNGWKYAGIGLQFAGSILLFLYAGQWVDARLGSGPIGLILGVFVGAGAAFFSMYRRLMADLAREEGRRSGRGGS
ncbi:MAG: AtpZ/AtpI family protein [Gemmatimonadetes bacterium]|nr:AtpZ/AtpI family protein [Gemmatimonadota bacterium]